MCKLASYPKISLPERLLYVRALKMDVLGEPVMHHILTLVEAEMGASTYTGDYPKESMRRALAVLGKKLLGDEFRGTDDRLSEMLTMDGDLSREAVLTLMMETAPKGRMGAQFVFGAKVSKDSEEAVNSHARAAGMLRLNRHNFLQFLQDSGQVRSLELLDDMDKVLSGEWHPGLESKPPS